MYDLYKILNPQGTYKLFMLTEACKKILSNKKQTTDKENTYSLVAEN